MPTQQYPVRIAVKDQAGNTIRECTLNLSDGERFSSHTFQELPPGEYSVEYTPPHGFDLTSANPTRQTLSGEQNTLQVGVEFKETPRSHTPYAYQTGLPSGQTRPYLATSSNLLLNLVVGGLIGFGSLGVGSDFVSRFFPPRSLQPPLTKEIEPPLSSEPLDNLERSFRSITILACNGDSSSANFRSLPSRSSRVVLGYVEQGQKVFLTGQTEIADGIVWHEAIAKEVKPDPGQYVTQKQRGWIADCFVR